MNKIIMEVPFFQVPNDIFELGLSTNEMMVFFYLARCGNNGKVAFPSYNTIADKTGTSKSTVIRVIKNLEEKGLIVKQIRKDYETGRNKSNTYKVAVNLSQLKNDGVTQTQGIVSERNKDSVTVKPNKELSINNNIDKEINNIHTLEKHKSDEEVFNKYYDKYIEIECDFLKFTKYEAIIEIAGYFWTDLYNHKGIKHGKLSNENIKSIINNIKQAYENGYIKHEPGDCDFTDEIYAMFDFYFAENRKYYSLQEFAQLKNFEIWATRLNLEDE
jgi:predicted transcriptional regulator